MKSFILILIMTFIAWPVSAEMHPPAEGQSRVGQEVPGNDAVAQKAFARAQKLKSVLSPEARNKLDLVARNLAGRLVSDTGPVDIPSIVQREINRNFAPISGEQLDLLSFYVLAETDRILKNSEALKGTSGGLNEMSEMTSLRLNMTMDRRSKFINTLKKILEKVSDTQDGVVQNIK